VCVANRSAPFPRLSVTAYPFLASPHPEIGAAGAVAVEPEDDQGVPGGA
jgi:hypothetical protein